jgi:hypothetical protein
MLVCVVLHVSSKQCSNSFLVIFILHLRHILCSSVICPCALSCIWNMCACIFKTVCLSLEICSSVICCYICDIELTLHLGQIYFGSLSVSIFMYISVTFLSIEVVEIHCSWWDVTFYRFYNNSNITVFWYVWWSGRNVLVFWVILLPSSLG